MLSIHMLNDVPVSSFGLCLFNSSSTSMCINERAVPSHVSPERGEAETVTTTQGTYSSQKYFNSSTSRYDFIVGRDILRFGFILDHAHNCMHHLGRPFDTDDCARPINITRGRTNVLLVPTYLPGNLRRRSYTDKRS